MRKKFILLLVIYLAGCATVPKSSFDAISNETSNALCGTGMLSVEVMPGKGMAHHTNAEQAMMASGMMFGAIGGALGAVSANASANRRGAELVKTSGLIDPSLSVAEKMRQRLPQERPRARRFA